MNLRWHIIFTELRNAWSASAAVKVSAIQNAENVPSWMSRDVSSDVKKQFALVFITSFFYSFLLEKLKQVRF